jgi:hypothetical protein
MNRKHIHHVLLMLLLLCIGQVPLCNAFIVRSRYHHFLGQSLQGHSTTTLHTGQSGAVTPLHRGLAVIHVVQSPQGIPQLICGAITFKFTLLPLAGQMVHVVQSPEGHSATALWGNHLGHTTTTLHPVHTASSTALL